MSSVVDYFQAPCGRCKCSTRHSNLKKVEESGDDEYRYYLSYSIISCMGCGGISFEKKFKDIENAYPIDDDEWEVPEDINYYPNYDLEHANLEEIYLIPELVRGIYKESYAAVKEGALILAGLGLRGTVEAICNERNIVGRNLEVRITKLAQQGLISSKDAERLHAIRFLGNDAAHEIKKPKITQISVALKIINHLIQSVYILENEANENLDTILSNQEQFENLLTKNLKNFNSNDELPLAKYLGRDMRRLGAGASALEMQLISEINSGNYTKLKVGKSSVYAGSSSPIQHFIVV